MRRIYACVFVVSAAWATAADSTPIKVEPPFADRLFPYVAYRTVWQGTPAQREGVATYWRQTTQEARVVEHPNSDENSQVSSQKYIYSFTMPLAKNLTKASLLVEMLAIALIYFLLARLGQILDGNVDLRILLHQLDDALVGRLQAEVERTAAGFRRRVPDFRRHQ